MKRRDFFRGLAALAVMAPVITLAKEPQSLSPVTPVEFPKVTDWAEEVRRCREGYIMPSGEFMSGYQYFYVNYAIIARMDEDHQRYIYGKPYFRNQDKVILDQLWEDRHGIDRPNNTFNLQRGRGWSSLVHGCLLPWNLLFSDHLPSISVVKSDMLKRDMIRITRMTVENTPSEMRKQMQILGFYHTPNMIRVLYENYPGNKVTVITPNKLDYEIAGCRINDLFISDYAYMDKKPDVYRVMQENELAIKLGKVKWGSIIAG